MQNLNLYQPERRQRGGPRPRQMLLGLAALALLLLLHGLWQGWQLYRADQALQLAERRAQQAETSLAGLQASFVEPTLDPALPRQLAELEAGNRQLRRLSDHLQLLDRQRRAGFVAPLDGLAKQHPPTGLWLTGILLDEGGTQLRLEGLSRKQALLPDYLARLGQSPSFAGRRFARFQVERQDDGLLSFRLASRAGDPEESP